MFQVVGSDLNELRIWEWIFRVLWYCLLLNFMFVRFDRTVCSCSLSILEMLVKVFGCLNVQAVCVRGHLALSGLP